jgi:hypothetical protein
MRRSVWTRHLYNHAISGAKCARGGVVELMTIVALDDFDGATKLCGDISNFFGKVERVLDLTWKGKVHKNGSNNQE